MGAYVRGLIGAYPSCGSPATESIPGSCDDALTVDLKCGCHADGAAVIGCWKPELHIHSKVKVKVTSYLARKISPHPGLQAVL